MLNAVLEFVHATRAYYANPLDFLTKQDLTNTLKNVINANKALISALDTVARSQEEEEEEAEVASLEVWRSDVEGYTNGILFRITTIPTTSITLLQIA